MPRTLAPPPFLVTVGDTTAAATLPQLSHGGAANKPSSSAIVAIIVVASAIIISASLYHLLRCVTRRFRRRLLLRTVSAADDAVVVSNNHDGSPRDFCLYDSLPVFAFSSVAGNLAGGSGGGDCAVCLSRFEASDQLRLLPLCCHAFHSHCIDTWLSSNQTCPLCRSTVYPTEADVLDKILSSSSRRTNSFRVEIGSLSRRRPESDSGDGRRSYSIGSFEYVVGDGCEVAVGSFRSSGRLGSSRRNVNATVVSDLETSRMGEEISEFFRWFSGV